jgi:aerotaxis receptor
MDERIQNHAITLAYPFDAARSVGGCSPHSRGIGHKRYCARQRYGGHHGSLALASWALEAQIARPLERALKQALRVTSGDAQNALHMDRVDEIGMTARTIGQLGPMVRWVVDDVSAQVRNVQNAISEIAQGNGNLNSRTEQAASSVQETAASMEQMTATTQSNADTARQTNQLSGLASDAAARGGKAVLEVAITINEISRSSEKIAKIIGVIDGIAFQTNILALNAAVEAARAGVEGRGFAVVAGEVRNLARRSADAAKEIKDLISVSAASVESGSERVADAGKTMDDIVRQVEQVSNLIGEISSVTNEQSAGIAQMEQAFGHLDQVTQQNVALVEQSTAASQSLNDQAKGLVDAVSVSR